MNCLKMQILFLFAPNLTVYSFWSKFLKNPLGLIDWKHSLVEISGVFNCAAVLGSRHQADRERRTVDEPDFSTLNSDQNVNGWKWPNRLPHFRLAQQKSDPKHTQHAWLSEVVLSKAWLKFTKMRNVATGRGRQVNNLCVVDSLAFGKPPV